jgi:hypothetical protein
MKPKHLTILFAVLAATFLPGAAHAQDYEYCGNYVCESYAVYDPSGEISGYTRTVDYGDFGESGLQAVATLGDPNGNTVSYDSEWGYGEADAYVWWAVGSSYGLYGLQGAHYYFIEDDDESEGGNPLGYTYWSVDATEPPANITSVTPSPPWQAGSTYSFTVNGTNFGMSPSLTIFGPDGSLYYNGSCSNGWSPGWQPCGDSSFSDWVSIPSNAPSGDATVTLSPGGYNGLGLQQTVGWAPQPTSAPVAVVGTVVCPTTIQLSGDVIPLNLPYGNLMTGIGGIATMLVGPGPQDFTGAQITEAMSAGSNSCPSNPDLFPPPVMAILPSQSEIALPHTTGMTRCRLRRMFSTTCTPPQIPLVCWTPPTSIRAL